jgi:NitT/TauT family transport system substrate-binding protein
MTRRTFIAALTATTLALGVFIPNAHAEVSSVRLSHGYGILYMPLIVMRDQQLLEKHAKRLGLGDIKTSWLSLDGGNVINDAMLSGNLDIAGTGAPGFITLWSKAQGIPRSEVISLGAMSTTALSLLTNNPAVKTLKDFTPKDKIAIPGIKTSLAAVVLQMAAAKTFGIENYAKLDPLTVSLSHPDATSALLSGKTEITAHFASPPFSYQEAKDPKIKSVLNSPELLGNITLDVVFAPKHFVVANPKITQAFMAAQEEANAYIAANKKGAAEAYVRVSKLNVSVPEMETMLADPDTQFSSTPKGMMDYVLFMAKAKTIRTKPAKWSDMFVPALEGREGS